MNWITYEKTLLDNLNNWLSQITAIQNKEFEEEEILFELNENTLDVFSAMIDAYSSNISMEEWLENEKTRQKQKSLQTKIGDLHEIMILSLIDSIQKKEAEAVKDSDKPYRIFDLYDEDNRWIAEIKNKHNTTKGDDRKASFDKLVKGLEIKGDDYKAYYVTILRDGHNKINKPFTPSDNTSDKKKMNPNIIHMDGESFYHFITGEEGSLQKAFDCLNNILKTHFSPPNDERGILEEIKSLSFFSKKVNINTAHIPALCYLPGIGESTAELIINYRIDNGLFTNIEHIKRVKRIGQATFDKLRNYIVCS